MDWAVPLLVGLAGVWLARRRQNENWRAAAASFGLFWAIWASNTFPAFPPRVQTDWLAWGLLLPLFWLPSRLRVAAQGLLVAGLSAASHLPPDWGAVLLTGFAGALAPETQPIWRSRASGLLMGVAGALALYTGSSARLAVFSVAWGLLSALTGGGSAWPLAVLAFAGHTFASLPDSLFLGMLLLSAAGLRQPIGWLAAAWIGVHADLQTV